MANITLSQVSYVDYVGSLFFKAMNVINLKVTPKVVQVNNEDVILMHLSGVQTSTGIIVDMDLWPRDSATKEDIEKLPKSVDDITFRIGYHKSIDDEGNVSYKEGKAKWLSYRNGEDEFRPSGEKRVFQEEEA